MEREITIGIQYGNVIFSFKTDQAGTGMTDAIKSIRELLKKHGESLRAIRINESPTANETSTPKITEKPPPITLGHLGFPNELLSIIQVKIRKVPYMDLVLLLLHFAPRSLSYDDIMSLSREIKKPISYEWLNTEFHRRKYSGLVRSEEVGGSLERLYSLNEPGRRRAEAFLKELKIS